MNLTKTHTDGLLRKANVNLIYEYGNLVIVGVEKKIPESALSKADLVPQDISGMRTDVIETGRITAPPMAIEPFERTEKYRPAPGGCSIGHKDITAGTLGMWVIIDDDEDDEWFILSNNHVLANSNYGQLGDEILQPGPYDIDGGNGSCPFANAFVDFGNFVAKRRRSTWRLQPFRTFEESEYLIGWLHKYVPLDFSGNYNQVDAALARPIGQDEDIVDPYILEIGIPQGFARAEIGETIWKSGRTSEVTSGTITSIDAIAKVSYGNRVAIFDKQILTTHVLDGGDSGSGGWKSDKQRICGLGYAGSDTISLFNHIELVQEKLGGFDVG